MGRSSEQDGGQLRRAVLGIGAHTHRKSYYPLLRQRVETLERLQGMLDASSDGILWLHPSDGTLIELNRAARRMIGASEAEDVRGRAITDFVTSEVWREVKPLLSGLVSIGDEAQTRFDTLWETRGAPAFPAEVTVGVGIMAGEPQVVLVVRDLTERVHAQQALEKSQKSYRVLFEVAGDGILVLKKETIVECNPRALKLFRCTELDLLGNSLESMSPPSQPDGVPSRVKAMGKIARALQGHDEFFEWRFRRPDGTMFHVEISLVHAPVLHPNGLLAMVRDITSRKLAEEERNRLAAAIEQAEEDVVITDLSGAILYVNPAFERITGYTRDEVLGQNPRILKSGEHPPEFYRDLWTTIASGQVWRKRMKNRRKDGRIIVEQCTISPIRDEAGVVAGYVALKQDITDQLAAEEGVRQAQKLEAIGTLAGGIAHDFNNILSAVLGFSALALADVGNNPDARESIQEIVRAGERARELVRQILTFSRRREQEFDQVYLHVIVKEAAKFLRGSIPSTIEINLEVDGDCPPIMGDPTQMHQVLMNLCTNAYHAMRDDADHLGERSRPCVIGIRLHQVEVGSERAGQLLSISPGSHLVLEVSDTGRGIPANILSRLFEPYFTTKAVGEGTGLGLATVRGIVELHGGGIEVESREGKGAVFRVFLPVHGEPIDAAEAASPSQAEIVGWESILIVDDEMPITELAHRVLSRCGFKVTACNDPVRALEVFGEDPDEFHLVITDLTMPGMTGVDLARALRKVRPTLPVLLCTGMGEAIGKQEVREAGFQAVLVKPVMPGEFAGKVRQVLDEAMA